MTAMMERRDSVERKEQIKHTEREEQLLRLIRELQFGEIDMYVADGQPVRVVEIY